ncbi:hypothetical protein ACJU26_05685 [Acidithiobacillus sp. M4-SHS-6]|uniref:hypothetical protein n=1 Tax=Acidithiobacillus sp. M4-SHS-6 TaxID=3383024 RepID=UPI0039BEBE7E
MEMTELEQQILNDEVISFLDRDQSDLETLWNQPGIAESCPPGVFPDTWMDYLTDLREATMASDDPEELRETIEIVQEQRPEPGGDKDWRDRQWDRNWHLMNMISAYNNRDEILMMEVEEDETGQTSPALTEHRKSLKHMKYHQHLRSLLDEPRNMDRNRQMWRLESLLVEYGHQDDWETELRTLETLEFQEQGLSMDETEDEENPEMIWDEVNLVYRIVRRQNND